MTTENLPTKSEKLTPRELLERHRFKGRVTPMFRDKAAGMVRAGAPPRTALRALGCSESTIRLWQSKAESGEDGGRYTDLWRALQDAEQECLARVAANAIKHTERDGRTAVEVLSRRDPEHWSRRDEVEVKVALNADAIFAQIAAAKRDMIEGKWEVLATSDADSKDDKPNV